MNEQALRSLVRQAIAKQLGVQGPAGPVPGSRSVQSSAFSPESPAMVPDAVPFGSHASHYLYMQLVNDNGGQCLIESKVPCNHCGYCQSHGH
jgi:hypothetical protein